MGLLRILSVSRHTSRRGEQVDRVEYQHGDLDVVVSRYETNDTVCVIWENRQTGKSDSAVMRMDDVDGYLRGLE